MENSGDLKGKLEKQQGSKKRIMTVPLMLTGPGLTQSLPAGTASLHSFCQYHKERRKEGAVFEKTAGFAG